MEKPRQTEETGARRVLSLLKRAGEATTKDLAAALGLTGMAVRKHLAALLRAGLVSYEEQRQPRGRPARVYRLTAAGHELFPKDYHGLALSLMEEIVRSDGPARLSALIKAYHEDLRRRAEQRLKGMSLEQRVAEVAAILDEQGHMAEWAPHPEGFVIREHNCTISRISQRFPQCCAAERELISALLGAPVERLADQSHGDPQCAYLVRAKARR